MLALQCNYILIYDELTSSSHSCYYTKTDVFVWSIVACSVMREVLDVWSSNGFICNYLF